MSDTTTIIIAIIIFILSVTWLKYQVDNFSFSRYTPRKKQQHYHQPALVVAVKQQLPQKKSNQVTTPIQKKAEWFIGDWGIGKPSAAEQLIIDELNKYHIKWEREVSFFGLQLPSKGWARFDFLLIDHMICIEYDGKLAHNTPARKEVDNIKTQFCSDNHIRLIRYNGEHYYHMEHYIGLLMKELFIRKK